MAPRKKWKRRLIGLALLTGLLVCSYFVMRFVYRLPDISTRQPAFRIEDGQLTTLGRRFGMETAAHPGQAGVFLLKNGRDAFAARALLARLAEKSLDILVEGWALIDGRSHDSTLDSHRDGQSGDGHGRPAVPCPVQQW